MPVGTRSGSQIVVPSGMRISVDALPVNEPICNACLMAFWLSDDDTTEH